MPTVVTDALTTRQKVKDFLNINDSSKDVFIDEAINNVTGFIKGYCGRQFLNQTYTNEMHDTQEGQRKIFLYNIPVTAISAVEYRAGTPAAPVWFALDANSYLTYLKEGYVYFYFRTPSVKQGMRFTYTAGYLINFAAEFDPTQHNLPYDLVMAATELVARIITTSGLLGLEMAQTEGQTVRLKDAGAVVSLAMIAVFRGYQMNYFML